MPLIVAMPSASAGRSGALVELVDLAPTILQAAGLPVPDRMQGRSLLPILAGEADPQEHKPYVTSEYWDAIVAPSGATRHSHATMRFDGRYKTVVYHGHGLGELYDLAEDPGEFDDFWFSPDARELRERLLLAHLDAYAATADAGPARTGDY